MEKNHTGIEKHRLRALILQDLEIYREVKISDLHQRIGEEIPKRRIQRELADMIAESLIVAVGGGRGRKYRIVPIRSESTENQTIIHPDETR